MDRSEPPDPRNANAGRAVRITLLTGDQVVLAGDDSARASVIPGEGRRDAGIAFRTFLIDDQMHVVPSDVAPLVAGGVLDIRLFNVTLLERDGYADADRDSFPLIVSGDDPSLLRAATWATQLNGVETTRSLPSIGAVAVEVDKDWAPDFLADLTAGDVSTLAAGLERIWLDGRVAAQLDKSVPQVGAPQAWDAGYTGDGVTVAVLDTGVDTTHPDLADQMVASKNFTDDSDLDVFGHGSHVASTIAGTGRTATTPAGSPLPAMTSGWSRRSRSTRRSRVTT